jgi:transcriptional regulator with XRE-family HTH domain
MQLRAYLDQHQLTQVQFAALVGVNQSAVAKWLDGTRPSWPTMERIVAATGGAVTPNDFLPSTSPAQAEDVAA